MANNAIIKIGKRAKQLYKAKGNKKSYIDCVKAAGKEYRSGKIGATKTKFRQTGKSDKKRDQERKAKPPGKRIVKHGRKKTVYYERRKNRSDVPGRLTGTSTSAYNEMMMGRLRDAVARLAQGESYMNHLQTKVKAAKSKPEKNTIRSVIKMQRKYISQAKSDIRIIKSLIK